MEKEWVQPKFSHGRSDGGRWGHRPRRTAPVGGDTNRRKFGMYSKEFINDFVLEHRK